MIWDFFVLQFKLTVPKRWIVFCCYMNLYDICYVYRQLHWATVCFNAKNCIKMRRTKNDKKNNHWLALQSTQKESDGTVPIPTPTNKTTGFKRTVWKFMYSLNVFSVIKLKVTFLAFVSFAWPFDRGQQHRGTAADSAALRSATPTLWREWLGWLVTGDWRFGSW